MPTNDQYVITNLEGKVKFSGESRKIKATQTSLTGILSSIPKTEKVVSANTSVLLDNLKAKQAIFHKIGEIGKVSSTGRKAINVSKNMFDTEKKNREIINNENLEKLTFKQAETEEKTNNEDTNADTIINALQIFENTNNLAEEDKNTNDETPAFMQVSGEIKNEEEKPAEEKPSETENTQTATVGKDFGVPSHENSGYLDGINAFKAQIGTDKYEHTSNRDFAAHINSEPQVSKYEEQPMSNFTVHTNENPMNINGSAEIQMNRNNANITNSSISDIDDFVRGYYDLEDLSLGKIRAYKTGCEEYVQQAKADKMKAGKEINGLDDLIGAKNEQIANLEAQIKKLEAEKTDLNNSKKDLQTVYSAANTKVSLGESKIDEINKFVYQEFNSMNDQMAHNSSSYSNAYASQGYSGGMEDGGFSRGRRAA